MGLGIKQVKEATRDAVDGDPRCCGEDREARMRNGKEVLQSSHPNAALCREIREVVKQKSID